MARQSMRRAPVGEGLASACLPFRQVRLPFRCQIILMLDVLAGVGEKLLIRRRMCLVSGAP